eukprot:6205180-Pleurochrysis_carterae.AAC.2
MGEGKGKNEEMGREGRRDGENEGKVEMGEQPAFQERGGRERESIHRMGTVEKWRKTHGLERAQKRIRKRLELLTGCGKRCSSSKRMHVVTRVRIE